MNGGKTRRMNFLQVFNPTEVSEGKLPSVEGISLTDPMTAFRTCEDEGAAGKSDTEWALQKSVSCYMYPLQDAFLSSENTLSAANEKTKRFSSWKVPPIMERLEPIQKASRIGGRT